MGGAGLQYSRGEVKGKMALADPEDWKLWGVSQGSPSPLSASELFSSQAQDMSHTAQFSHGSSHSQSGRPEALLSCRLREAARERHGVGSCPLLSPSN